MSVLCVVQARTGSQRLPGKVLEEILGTPMVLLVIERLKKSSLVDEILVATTVDDSDDELAQIVRGYGVDVVRGPVFDVLERYALAVESRPDATLVVRVTADCPFIDPNVVDDVIRESMRTGAAYVSNRLPPPHERSYPIGLDVEVFSRDSLFTARRDAVTRHDREHVTPYLYESGLFDVEVLQLPVDMSRYRWTVDTPEDLQAVRAIASRMTSTMSSWHELVSIMESEPDLMRINADVRQRSFVDSDERWTPE